MQNVTEVVAALIWDGARFLICQRPENKSRGLLWEFVGGKIDPGETGEEALRRECREELGIGVDVGEVFTDVTHEYPDMTVHLTLYSARIREGVPELLEHKALAWVTADEAENYEFCPADIVILEKLRTLAGNAKSVQSGDLTVHILLPEHPTDRIVYLHEPFERAIFVRQLLHEPKPVLAAIEGADWDRDLSPWAAPAVFRDAPDFGGKAAEHLNFLLETLIPLTEAAVPYPIQKRGIAGYSLDGLFAVWSLYQTDCFDACATMSGSLWFEGFTDYALEHPISSNVKRVYLSVGEREKNTKNPRMARVEDATRETEKILRERGISTKFELNPGGHFRDVPQRIARGIDFITKGD